MSGMSGLCADLTLAPLAFPRLGLCDVVTVHGV